MKVALRRQAESLRALGAVFRNPNLRRLELAFAGSTIGGWSYGIALFVIAYEAGGAAAVGLIGLSRWIPAAAAAPFTALLADRYPRERVMLLADVVRAVAIGVAAVILFLDGPLVAVFALAVLVSVVSTSFDPAQAALLPSLARTPRELTAANVTSSTIDSVGIFAGPALGGLLLATTSEGVVFAVAAALFVWSALLVSRIRAERPAAPDETESEGKGEGFVSEALAGFRAIRSDARLRLLVGLFGAQTLVDGALNVLVVVLAFEVLGLGESGVGFLNSAIGIGGLVGAVAAVGLVGRRRLAGSFGLGMLLWGVPIAAAAIWLEPAAALVLLAVVGIGNTIVDVSGLTLMQRTAPDEVLARVFGVVESLFIATLALGALIAPLAIELFGARATLIGTGAVLPVLTALAWRRLRAIDDAAVVPEREIELLRSSPIFSALPAPALEQLASRLKRLEIGAGEEIVRQGDVGDRFYVVDEGEVEVLVDGRPVRRQGRGEHFGEIALLRDVPRTATVRALADAKLFVLERDEFIAAVTGHAPSFEAANAVIVARLANVRPGLGSR